MRHWLPALAILPLLAGHAWAAAPTAQQARDLAEQAYRFSFATAEHGKTLQAIAAKLPVNYLYNRTTLLGPEDRTVVSPNNDTLYSYALLDLREHPVILDVPAVPQRYYSFQLIDMRTDNLDYIGTRATGREAGSFLIAGPDWDGKKPDDFNALSTWHAWSPEEQVRLKQFAQIGVGTGKPYDPAQLPADIAQAVAQGQALDGNRSYRLHFAPGQQPPAKEFWSITLYDLPDRQLVDNPIQRYCLSSRDPLLRDADGGVTLYLQADSPGKEHEANWLPSTRQGPFNVILRVYGPEQSVVGGKWQMPGVERV